MGTTPTVVADSDDLHAYYRDCKFAKPERRKKSKARKDRVKGKNEDAVRVYVRGREREICRCCRFRRAESCHELLFRSLRGKVSRQNSVAVCGQLVGAEPSCHTYLQANQITYEMGPEGAEGIVCFMPMTQTAADWLRVKVGERIESAPMIFMEQDA